MTWSTTKKNSAASADIASTLSVVADQLLAAWAK